MQKAEKMQELRVFAQEIRVETLKTVGSLGFGHVPGAMSVIDALAVLYGEVMKVDPKNPHWEDRDWCVLSKGHAGPAMYATLGLKGFYPIEDAYTLNQPHTNFPSHTDRTKTPGVDMTTGSLGQGTSAAAGIATGLRMKGSDRHVYLIVGDGELNEGQCWEAFEYIAANRMDNCITIIDWNKRQLDGTLEEVLDPFDIPAKMKAFGFDVQVVNGQDMQALDAALERAEATEGAAPCIVMDTVKGAGIPFFETYPGNHSFKFSDPSVAKAAHEALAEYDVVIEGSEA